MDATQQADIEQNIIDGVDVKLTASILAALTPSLLTLENQTSSTSIATAAATGVCEQTTPGGCMNNNITQPLSQQINDLSSGVAASAASAASANNVILQQMQPVLNTVNTTTQTTLDIVGHAQYGLQAISNFISTA